MVLRVMAPAYDIKEPRAVPLHFRSTGRRGARYMYFLRKRYGKAAEVVLGFAQFPNSCI